MCSAATHFSRLKLLMQQQPVRTVIVVRVSIVANKKYSKKKFTLAHYDTHTGLHQSFKVFLSLLDLVNVFLGKIYSFSVHFDSFFTFERRFSSHSIEISFSYLSKLNSLIFLFFRFS